MIAWHYTRGQHLPAILASGVIRPATAGVPAHERPVAWFSTHPTFERTALPGMVNQHDEVRPATLHEAFYLGQGLFRFGVDARELLTGEALQRAARINNATWRALLKSGRAQGADPSQWFGHVGPVPVERLTLQRLTKVGGAWVGHTEVEAAA